MKLKDQINSYLQKVIENITEEKAEIEIQSAQESIHGDYSTNVAMRYAPQSKKNPKAIAGEFFRTRRSQMRRTLARSL